MPGQQATETHLNTSINADQRYTGAEAGVDIVRALSNVGSGLGTDNIGGVALARGDVGLRELVGVSSLCLAL
jgi:hypothetical protein